MHYVHSWVFKSDNTLVLVISPLHKKLIMNQLHDKILELEEKLSESMSPEIEKLLCNSKEDLEDLIQEETLSVIFRSKAKYVIEAERNTKYFYSLEKSKYNAKTCAVLLDGDAYTRNPKRILALQQDYYKKLYASDPDIQFTLEGKAPNAISSDSKGTC